MINNPIVKINNTVVQTIGDPHLGRTFKTGVPSSRLKDREALILDDLKKLLNPTNTNINFVVIVGDLFDKFIVQPYVVDLASSLLSEASINNPNIQYYVIPGNHDLSKDKSKVSSYYLFYKILENCSQDNLTILLNKPLLITVDEEYTFYFDVYNPFHKDSENDSIDFIKNNLNSNRKLISFGHWDDPTNNFASYLPDSYLIERSEMLISGHIHTPKRFKLGDTEFIYTGSLQPYSHAEDPNQNYYITVNYKELEKDIQNSNTESYINKNIRVSCYPGYILPEPIDALSITYFNNLIAEDENNCTSENYNENIITDFTTLFLKELKEKHDIDNNVLIKLNNFLKDTTGNVHFTLD